MATTAKTGTPRVPATPNLPISPVNYSQQYNDQLLNVLRLYFNQLNNAISGLSTNMASSTTGTNTNPTYVAFSDGEVDAFGRLRISNPYTLFDSQSRFASDAAFDTSTATGGTVTYNPNQSSTAMAVTTASGSQVVAQTFRYFPYQPGKSLLILNTFVMATAKANLTQRVGYFDANNGVYFEQSDTTLNMVVRSYTSGAVVDTAIPQAQWNGDKMDGTGTSGFVLDVTKTQIWYCDLEWLGVGIVRVGFIVNGMYVNCHTFYNANSTQTTVYMTTATLPVRYEITNTGATASGSTLTKICSSVMSEGGYDQTSQVYWARRTTDLALTTTTFVPLVSIRLKSSRTGAVVVPQQISVLPTSNGNYELALIRNGTLGGATAWDTTTFADVEYDVASTTIGSYTSANIAQVDYLTASNQSTSSATAPLGYKWDLQLGVSLSGTSDIITLCARMLSGTGSIIGSLGFYDLTA